MERQIISSRKNKIIKAAVERTKTTENRKESGLYLIEGARLCEDAAKSGVEIQSSFVTEKALKAYSKYINEIDAVCMEAYLIEEHVAQLLSQTKTSQGVFALCKIKEQSSELPKGKLVALENIQDPGNMGAIMRTAEALGIDGILLLGSCCDIYSPKTLRSSMGAAFRMKTYEFLDVKKFFSEIEKTDAECFAAVPDSDAKKLGSFKFPDNSVVFIGNEGNGLSKELLILCKNKVTIPMGGRAESLNAAASAAILMWEMLK